MDSAGREHRIGLQVMASCADWFPAAAEVRPVDIDAMLE